MIISDVTAHAVAVAGHPSWWTIVQAGCVLLAKKKSSLYECVYYIGTIWK